VLQEPLPAPTALEDPPILLHIYVSMIDHIHGDTFIDCKIASQAVLRSIFGVWISVFAGVVAFCVRFIFRSRVVSRLLSRDAKNRQVSLWVISPAATSSGAWVFCRGWMLVADVLDYDM
jgi:hypothetical protein